MTTSGTLERDVYQDVHLNLESGNLPYRAIPSEKEVT